MSLLVVFVVWVLGFGACSIVARKMVAATVARWNAPVIVRYYLCPFWSIVCSESIRRTQRIVEI
ncbi:MAG: hypothetical protein JXB07_20930, partial [Anaerolineae bacterium]|nr:hypothetical protein [Anaerolineae bacterium]